MERIPVAAADLSGREAEYVAEAVRSTWISSTGPFVERFEAQWARLCGARAAIATANGSVAIVLAVEALGVEPGDEVIVPDLTFVATANAVRQAGATPVLVDVDAGTWGLDAKAVERALTPRTRGIVPVHLYGHPADMDPLHALAARHRLWVLEDAAEAHLARHRGRAVGGLSEAATFSFYGNKILTCGEGGAVTLSDPALERRARLLRGQGMDPSRRYWFPVVGHNFRLTNVACALLCAQLERHEEILARRRAVFERYRARLADVPGIALQPRAPWADPVPWLFCLTVEEAFGRTRDDLAERLGAAGIETRPFFHPLHHLPPYAGPARARGHDFPVTERLARTGLNLPTFNAMTAAQVDRVCDAVRAARG